jgi:hypothetical protein
MNKSQRASETQSKINNIKQSITSIRKEMNPIPTVSSIGSNPRAKPTAKTRWLRRSVRLTAQTTTNSVVINYSDIGVAMGALSGEAYTVKVLGIKAWNVTGQSTNSNSINLALSSGAIVNSFPNVVAEDFGSAMSLPGVKVNIPDLLAASVLTSATSSLCTVVTPFGGTSTQNICLDVDLMVQM